MIRRSILAAAFAIAVSTGAGDLLHYPAREFHITARTERVTIINPIEFADDAIRLQGALEQLGMEAAVVNVEDATYGWSRGLRQQYRSGTVILLGGLESNNAVLDLYSRFVTDADAHTPGEGGTLIQYVPGCYGPASAVLIVSESSQAGTSEAINELVQSLERGETIAEQRTYEFKSDIAIAHERWVMQQAGRAINQDKSWHNFYALAEAHRLTGDAKYLDAVLRSAANMTRVRDNHYGMGLPVRGWDYWARSGLITADLLQKVDQIFLDYLVHEQESWWRRKEAKAVFADNRHHVYGTWGYYQVAQMLYRGLTAAQKESETGQFILAKIKECEQWFAACCRAFRPPVLSIGMVTNMTLFTLYALQSGDDWLFTSGTAEEYIKLATAVTDNTGGSIGISGYEDTYPGMWRNNYAAGAMVNMAAYYYQTGTGAWLKKNLAGWSNSNWWRLGSDNHAYAAGIAPEPAAEHIGFVPVFGENEPLYLAHRHGFAPEDLYFCITGSGVDDIDTGDSGKGRQVYPNMIARLSWQGIPWLVTNTNHVSPLHRNALTIDARDAGAGMIEANMQLAFTGKDKGVSFASCLTTDYCGVDWTRAFIVAGNDFMLVKDEITARETDEYAAAITWRSPFAAEKTDDHSTMFRFGGKQLNMSSAGTDMVATHTFRANEQQGALTPYIVRQYFNTKLRKGQKRTVYNLFYPGERILETRMVLPGVIALKNMQTDKITLLGFGNCTFADIRIEAAAFLLGEASFAAVDGVLTVAGKTVNEQHGIAELQAQLVTLWDNAVAKTPSRSASTVNSEPAEIVWDFTGFEGGYREFTGFAYHAPTAANLDNAFDGNIKRYAHARWPRDEKLDIGIEFTEAVELRQIAMLYFSDGGNAQRYKNLPQEAKPVRVFHEETEIEVNTTAYFELDETYKGKPFTYTGAMADVHSAGRKFRVVADSQSLYQMRLFGGVAKESKILDALDLGNGTIAVRNDRNEIACLDAASGQSLWLTQVAFEIRRWAFNNNIIGLACSDSTIKGIDVDTGRLLWDTDTTVIRLGIPYDIATFKDGFIYSSYYHMNPITATGDLLDVDQNYIPGMWLYDVMGNIDLNGDGVPDAISRALWGHVNLYDGKTGQVDYFANLRGRLVDWRILSGKDDKPDLLVVSRNGMARYNAHIRPEKLMPGFERGPDLDALLLEERSQREVWSLQFNSQVAAMLLFKEQIVLAFNTGMVRRYSLQGEELGSFYAGGPVIGLSNAGNILLVNTGAEIVLSAEDFDVVRQVKLKNNGVKVFADGEIVVAFTPNGIVRIRI